MDSVQLELGVVSKLDVSYANPLNAFSTKITDFRGQGLINAIHLSWTIKWRRHHIRSSFEPQSHTDWDEGEVGVEAVESLQVAPNVMLRLIWSAGDAEPAENMISAAFTSYTLKELHNLEASRRLPIPVNLMAHGITPTGATLQWELPQEFHKSRYRDILGYQVRYYPTRRHDTGESVLVPSVVVPVSPLVKNVSDPEATSVVLQNLEPDTVYEFAVRVVSLFNGAPKLADAWSMVQGFETPGQLDGDRAQSPMSYWELSILGALSIILSSFTSTAHLAAERAVNQLLILRDPSTASSALSRPLDLLVAGFKVTDFRRPESPPQNITVSAVMTGYLTPPDSLGDNGGSRDGASILVNWHGVAEVGARGLYHLYISPADEFGAPRTRGWSQQRSPRRQWSKHAVSGGQNSTVLHNLRTGQPYLLVMSAQNRFGRSPLSSLCFFRTADADGSGFIYLNTLGERYELEKMTPLRIQRLFEELEVVLKTLRSSDAARTVAPDLSDGSVNDRQNQWILVAAVLAVIAIIVIILAVTIVLTRRFSRSRLDGVRKEYLVEKTKRIAEKGDVNSPRTPTSHNNHQLGSPSCSEVGLTHRVGGTGLESLMHVPPPLPPVSFENSTGFSPYAGLPFVMDSGVGVNGGGGFSVASSSVHSQPVRVHANAPTASAGGVAGRGGSESDCRTTPIDSDLESAKSANLVTAFSYHQAYHQHPLHQTLSPARQHGTASPPVVATATAEKHSALGHPGLIGSPDMRAVGNEGKRGGCYRSYHPHQPVPLPPKMEDLFTPPNKSPGRPLILPYRELGRLETAGVVGATGSSESAEASRSIAGSSGYDSGAPTNNQPSGVGDRVLTESFMARHQPHLDTHSVNSGTLPRKFIPPTSGSERSRPDEMRYQNHASIKLNSYSSVLPIPRISALDERSLSKVYSTEELTEEMANLEGLMKNLTAITQNDFDCTSELHSIQYQAAMGGCTLPSETNTSPAPFTSPLPHSNNSDVFENDASLHLARVICTQILMPIVCVVGMASNALNIVVLTMATMHSSTSCYLCAVAVYDLLYSLTGLPLTLRTYPSLEMSSIYMNALSYLLPLGNILLAAIITLPDFFSWGVREAWRACSHVAERSNINHTSMNSCVEMFYIFESTWISAQLDRFGWSYAIVALFVFIPLIILTIFNALLIRSDKQSITITLIAVVVVFCIFNAPSAVVYLIRSWFKPSDARLKIFGNISNLLLMLNASVNIFLYSLFSARFRRKRLERLAWPGWTPKHPRDQSEELKKQPKYHSSPQELLPLCQPLSVKSPLLQLALISGVPLLNSTDDNASGQVDATMRIDGSGFF
ncbi:peptide (FMRFamide/neurokinin-3)-like receptor [Echinococcus granulosus]|uniref:Peptide (FMRFamide/neurokinin-3)-like receptor n=1 Tax=Echinococcus granulosus TaxID=6210 RepID=W6UK37_ECHGR|nr:peptide (FMRFamide/neurokinin-3)-like receptor [Echinococcus granulosus]EUB61910.1 peptide (FMRFamide/neurokinin-3)-like receptor [Echinococcus granulosus]